MAAIVYRVPVLVVDDDEDDRTLIEKALRISGILNPIYLLEDGKELMDYLSRTGKYSAPESSPEPGIILLDLNMPRIDGRTVLLLLKKSEAYQQIPVVILTTSNDLGDIQETYRRGANVYFTKPNDFDGLKNLMETVKNHWVNMAKLPIG